MDFPFEKRPLDKILALKPKMLGYSLLGMILYGGINRLNPDLARDLID
jgi:hypothetical protein